jgi:hypothetical protein
MRTVLSMRLFIPLAAPPFNVPVGPGSFSQVTAYGTTPATMNFAPGGTNIPHHHPPEEEIYLLVPGSREAQLDRVADFESVGREFESPRAPPLPP